ncbi:peptidase C45 acyl-coenzyme A:6-aminopenicillanic acid acyl-transferase [Penicillium malachiteum]|nr:peptidase C45 acyl-coenzyme A:6-aminopenicillanic acid acyl-transferase [Penicillium malachiteum]
MAAAASASFLFISDSRILSQQEVSEIANAEVPDAYQHVVVRGLPYDRGCQHGQQAMSKVQANVEYYKTPGKLAEWELMHKIINEVYDLARLNTKETADEKDDMANECTSAFLLKETTLSGDVLNAQKWDMSARLWLTDTIIYLEVHPDPSERKPSLFLATEAGQLGRYGMNSLGVGVTSNSLMSTEDSDCFGFCLEITPSRVYKVYCNIDNGYLIHTNHFTDNSFLARDTVQDRYPGGSSWHRRQRLEQGIRPYRHELLTNEQLIRAFSDHLSYPEALCCHPDHNPLDAVIGHLPGYPFRSVTATVACIIYSLSQGTITTCKGPPCQGVFKTFHLSGPKTLVGNQLKNGNGNIERPEVP